MTMPEKWIETSDDQGKTWVRDERLQHLSFTDLITSSVYRARPLLRLDDKRQIFEDTDTGRWYRPNPAYLASMKRLEEENRERDAKYERRRREVAAQNDTEGRSPQRRSGEAGSRVEVPSRVGGCIWLVLAVGVGLFLLTRLVGTF